MKEFLVLLSALTAAAQRRHGLRVVQTPLRPDATVPMNQSVPVGATPQEHYSAQIPFWTDVRIVGKTPDTMMDDVLKKVSLGTETAEQVRMSVPVESAHPQRQRRPHIVFALIDDLGYAGLGFSSPRGEPHTPVMDDLAQDGVVLKRHYAFKFCGPSRSSFLSGRLPIHVTQNNCDLCGIPEGMMTVADVLQRAGYATHHAGKWHAGMASHSLLPTSRGFNSSLAMLGGAADHYTSERPGGPNDAYKHIDLWYNDGPAAKTNQYSTFRYMNHALKVIKAHDCQQPMFLFIAFQSVHYPMQVPHEYLRRYAGRHIFESRANGLAQVSLVDDSIGRLVEALKAKSMWDDTLFVVSSDNGGPPDHESNYPFRGAKGSDLEGGIRVVAFASGPFLPKAARGKEVRGITHIADWYSTFAHLAGAEDGGEDHLARALRLPPVDSVNLWPALSAPEATESPREELVVAGGKKWSTGSAAFFFRKFKLIRGTLTLSCLPGPTTPNSTEYGQQCTQECGDEGCLYDLEEDPTEQVDVAAKEPELKQLMLSRARELDATQIASDFWSQPDIASVHAAVGLYGGVWGPWQTETRSGTHGILHKGG